MIVRLQVEVAHRDGRVPRTEEIRQAVVDLLEDMALVDMGPAGDSVYEVVRATAVEPPRGPGRRRACARCGEPPRR
jgi:hypothetical protein